jgi:hypothetical protein
MLGWAQTADSPHDDSACRSDTLRFVGLSLKSAWMIYERGVSGHDADGEAHHREP